MTETFGEQVKTNNSTVEQCIRQPSSGCLSHIFPFSPSLSLTCFNWTTFFPLTLVHLTNQTDQKSPTPPFANRDAAKRKTVTPHSRKWVFYSLKSDWADQSVILHNQLVFFVPAYCTAQLILSTHLYMDITKGMPECRSCILPVKKW